MTIGPVQLLVLGFRQPDFQGEILAELDRLKDSDTVRVIDSLAVYKDASGEVTTLKRSDLSADEAAEFGAVVGALLGLGAGGEEGMEAGALAGAEATAEGVEIFTEEDAWDAVEEIPNDSAAALVLLEHRWAIPLRDAIVRAGGFPISDGFIHPLDLVATGLVTAEEAEAMAAAEKNTLPVPEQPTSRRQKETGRCRLQPVESRDAQLGEQPAGKPRWPHRRRPHRPWHPRKKSRRPPLPPSPTTWPNCNSWRACTSRGSSPTRSSRRRKRRSSGSSADGQDR